MYGTDRLYDTLELHGTPELLGEKHENKWAVWDIQVDWDAWVTRDIGCTSHGPEGLY